jgi:4-hydroxybenzoate polyprenyltransferase
VALKKFLNFVKIEHTLFSLPLIYGGAFLAMRGLPPIRTLILILIGAVGARTVALALNRIIDREIDKRNPRTAIRELPSGRMNLAEAAGILIVGLLLYFVSAYFIGEFCLVWSPLPLAVFVFYPYMKRFTPLAHFGVGAGLAMASLGGWVAIAQSLDTLMPGIWLGLFTMFWVTGFDIIYSTMDEAFDRSENLYSFPSRFGRERALHISAVLHLLAFATLVLVFNKYLDSLAALPLLLTAGILLYYEHKQAANVELAFFKINAVLGFVVFGMIALGVYYP